MMKGEYMIQQRAKRVIISGGGTGGHIFPAISIANALTIAAPGIEILFVGAIGRMEMEKVPAAGYSIVGLPVSGLHRKKVWKNFMVVFRLIKSVLMARTILKGFNPDVVVGVGGYASGPVLWAAGRRKIPMLIQEQNSFAGVTNRLLAKKASSICVAYSGMERYFPAKKIIITGNPVRNTYENLHLLREEAFKYFGIEKPKTVILVLGGSLGAGSVNRTIEKSPEQLRSDDTLWLWQSGKHYYQNASSMAGNLGLTNIKVLSFIERMDFAYAAADIIVSRAGAGTISELCLVGKPVILVPSPNVAEDHQTKNAMALVKNEAAIMVDDKVVSEKLPDYVEKLANDKAKREKLSENIRKMALPGSDRIIAEEVLKLAGI